MLPTACEIFEGLCGHVTAMHWRYKFVDLILICHSSFALGPLAALQTLLNHVTIVLTAIDPPSALAPRELCYCVVRVIGVFILLLLAFAIPSLFGLARFGDSPSPLITARVIIPSIYRGWCYLLAV